MVLYFLKLFLSMKDDLEYIKAHRRLAILDVKLECMFHI